MTMQLSESQQKILQEFRISTKDIFSEDDTQVDDAFLLRWLIAREFNPDKAYSMLKNYVEWTRVNDIERILEWSPMDELKEACPYQIIPNDLEGRPVLIFPWGRWKPWVFAERFSDVYQKYMDYMINTVIKAIKPPATQFVILGDSDGFTYGHMKYIKALEINLEAVKQFEAHYPELMHTAIVINCPRAFTLLFSLVKPLMSHRTRNKVNLFGSDKQKWKNFLAARIPQDQLPNSYRVDTDNNGGGGGDMKPKACDSDDM